MTIPNLIPTNLDACQVAIRRDGVKGRVLAYVPEAVNDIQIAVLWQESGVPFFYPCTGFFSPDRERSQFDLVAVEPAAAETESPWITRYGEAVFVVFDPTTDGAHILGGARSFEQAQHILDQAGTDDDRADLYEFLRTCTLSESDEPERLWCAVGNELYPGQETNLTPEQFDAVVRETKRRWEARK